MTLLQYLTSLRYLTLFDVMMLVYAILLHDAILRNFTLFYVSLCYQVNASYFSHYIIPLFDDIRFSDVLPYFPLLRYFNAFTPLRHLTSLCLFLAYVIWRYDLSLRYITLFWITFSYLPRDLTLFHVIALFDVKWRYNVILLYLKSIRLTLFYLISRYDVTFRY